jgi:hypothetical protein
MERLELDPLFRWFVGSGVDEPTWELSAEVLRRRVPPRAAGADFVEVLRTMNVRPHVAQNVNGQRAAIDKWTTRHPEFTCDDEASYSPPSLGLHLQQSAGTSPRCPYFTSARSDEKPPVARSRSATSTDPALVRWPSSN